MSLLRAMKQFERAFVDGALAYLAVKTRNGFRVVVEHIGADREDGVERVPIAPKVRDQDFDFTAGDAAADFLDGACENLRATIGLVIAIDAGDYSVAKAHAGNSFSDAKWLFFIGWADWLAGRYGAKPAGACADVAENHKGRSAVFPTFAHVGATSAFADGVQIERAHDALEILVAFTAKKFDTQPVRAWVHAGRRYARRRGVGDDVEGRGHKRS